MYKVAMVTLKMCMRLFNDDCSLVSIIHCMISDHHFFVRSNMYNSPNGTWRVMWAVAITWHLVWSVINLNFSHFNHLLQNFWTKLDSDGPWKEEIQICSNEVVPTWGRTIRELTFCKRGNLSKSLKKNSYGICNRNATIIGVHRYCDMWTKTCSNEGHRV